MQSISLRSTEPVICLVHLVPFLKDFAKFSKTAKDRQVIWRAALGQTRPQLSKPLCHNPLPPVRKSRQSSKAAKRLPGMLGGLTPGGVSSVLPDNSPAALCAAVRPAHLCPDTDAPARPSVYRKQIAVACPKKSTHKTGASGDCPHMPCAAYTAPVALYPKGLSGDSLQIDRLRQAAFPSGRTKIANVRAWRSSLLSFPKPQSHDNLG